MTLKKTLLMTAAAVMVSATGAAAEGYKTNASQDSNYNQEGAPMGQSSDQQATMNGDSPNVSNIAPAAGTSEPMTSAAVESDINASTIQSAQTSLREEGYTVSVDGIWGPQTAAALREFQQQKGLNATGQLNTETMAALDIQQ